MAVAVNHIDALKWGKKPPTPEEREQAAEQLVAALERKWPALGT